MEPELKQDRKRVELVDAGMSTGIFVRAKAPDGKWVSADIATLDRDSLMNWLRSGGSHDLAERTVALLLQHPPQS